MTDRRKVFIVGYMAGYDTMFKVHGWEIVDNIYKADLVQFTGGEDVSPDLYGEAKHSRTHSNPDRDHRERIVFNLCLSINKPMSGICRGGQFLNVMCGGKMWQHVDGHARSGTHDCIDELTGEVFQATSTHHQMMIPSKEGILLASAQESKSKEKMGDNGGVVLFMSKGKYMNDSEVVYYQKEKALCFQPHPEHHGHNKLASIYFHYLNQYPLKEIEVEIEKGEGL